MPQLRTDDPSGIDRESVEGLFLVVENEQYPLSTRIRKRPAKAVVEEQPVDALNQVDNTTFEEGVDQATFINQSQNRARLSNFLGEFRESFNVSNWQVNIARAGGMVGEITDELGRQIVLATSLLKRQMEITITGRQDRVQQVTGTAGVPRGLGDWIDSAGPADVPAEFRTPAAQIFESANLQTRADFETQLRAIAIQRGGINGLEVYAAPNIKQNITNFQTEQATGLAAEAAPVSQRTFTIGADQKKIVWSVNLVSTDHGDIPVFNHYWTNENTIVGPLLDADRNQNLAYILDFDLLEIRSLGQIMEVLQLPDEAGGPRGLVRSIWTLMIGNPLGHGLILRTT